jgi:hypothetical protein
MFSTLREREEEKIPNGPFILDSLGHFFKRYKSNKRNHFLHKIGVVKCLLAPLSHHLSGLLESSKKGR